MPGNRPPRPAVAAAAVVMVLWRSRSGQARNTHSPNTNIGNIDTPPGWSRLAAGRWAFGVIMLVKGVIGRKNPPAKPPPEIASTAHPPTRIATVPATVPESDVPDDRTMRHSDWPHRNQIISRRPDCRLADQALSRGLPGPGNRATCEGAWAIGHARAGVGAGPVPVSERCHMVERKTAEGRLRCRTRPGFH